MVDYNTNLKDWGSAGTEPPDGYSYGDGVPPVDVYDNWLIDNIVTDLQHLTSLTNDRVESDKGTSRPTSPEKAHLFADTSDGKLEWYDQSSTSWSRALDATGDVMEGGLTLNSGAKVKGNLNDDNSNTIWDYSAGEIPDSAMGTIDNTTLTNSSLNVAGNSVSLGGSTSVELGDLSNVSASGEGSGNGFNADKVDGKDADDLGVVVEDNGTAVYSPSTGVNFGTGIDVADDGDGTVTVTAASTLTQLTIDANKDWGNYDISNVRKFTAEGGMVMNKTLETTEAFTIEAGESMVVSGDYTVGTDSTLTIKDGGSMTVM